MVLMCLDCEERPAYKGGPVCLHCGHERETHQGWIIAVDKSAFVDPEPWTADQYRRYMR